MTTRAAERKIVNYFSVLELRCRCWSGCNAVPLQKDFLAALNRLRHDWARPLIVNSASRCKAHNEKVGGSPSSQHLLGLAVDLRVASPNDGKALQALAEKHGFRGIGVAKNFIHLDMREGATAHWEYS